MVSRGYLGSPRRKSLGLIVQRGPQRFVAPTLHFARTVDVMQLELRAAEDERQRRDAFSRWMTSLRFVAVQSFPAAMHRSNIDTRLLRARLADVTPARYAKMNPREMAWHLTLLVWLAAKASEVEPLHLFANSLLRGFDAIAPWLGATLHTQRAAEQWTQITSRFLQQDPHPLTDLLEDFFARWTARMEQAAGLERATADGETTAQNAA